MTSLIIKSKIWNKSNSPLINYKDKNFLKQKLTVERTGIISRRKDKIVFKQTENLNSSNNSSENTNYMNEPRTSELISIEKRANESNYYINCGDWPKDLVQLIDTNAVYFLYKGLTIENFLKEKQKYYVLNQGDIIKLGKIYLKILHIKLTGSNKKDDEDEKDKANATTDKDQSDSKKIVSDSESNSDEDNESDGRNDDNDSESNIKNEINKEDEDEEDNKSRKSEVIKRNYSPSNFNENNKKNIKRENESNQVEYSEAIRNNNFSYKRKNKKNSNKNSKQRLNRSFNGNLSDNNLGQKIKENINMNRSMSFTFKKSKLKNVSMNLSLTSFYKINNENINLSTKKKAKKYRNRESSKKVKKDDKDKDKQNSKKEKSIIKQKDNIKPQEKKEKGKICRICLSGEDNPVKNPLICPCTCKGSMKFIHYFCLKNWLNLKVESDLGYGRDLETEQPTITYSTKDIACELCKTKLPDYIKHKGKIYNVSFYKPKYNKFIVLESIRDDNRRTKFIHIIPLNRRQIIKIGRLNNCDLSLPDFSISRVHCCMYIESSQLFLENNSKFGTKILVQNPKLTMSPQYPLCIEVQKTYLKLRLQKPFSLFSCCNVYTTSVTKMLVYQKQNERCFDLFCSMVFKEDDNELEEDDEEINAENNNNNNEDVKNEENIKNESGKKDLKDNKSKIIEENENSKVKKKKTIKSESESENNKNFEFRAKEIVKCIELKSKENEIESEKEIINYDKNEEEKNNINKNIVNKTENKKIIKKENSIKSKKQSHINENKNKDKIKEKDKDIIIVKKDEIIEDKKNVKKENNKNNNDNQSKIENKEKDIKLKNDKDVMNLDFKFNKSRTIQENADKENIKKVIENEFKMNGRRRSLQKNETKNYSKIVEKFRGFEKKSKKNDDKEKIIPKIKMKEDKSEENDKLLKKQNSIRNKEKNKEEDIIKNELNRKQTKNLNESKYKEDALKKRKDEKEKNKNKIHYEETEEPILIEKEKEIKEIKIEKEKNEIKKDIINEDNINTNKNINETKKEVIEVKIEIKKETKQLEMKNESKNDIKEIKNLIKKEEKEIKMETKKKLKKINFETDIIKSNPNDINDDKESENNKSIRSELYRINPKKKVNKQSIDLNAINDLSYKQGQEYSKNKNSALDNYQSIFGLMPSKQNETALLLAPKHTKNKDLKHFDLNINEKMNLTNKSNISWSKYTSQYEENKHK